MSHHYGVAGIRGPSPYPTSRPSRHATRDTLAVLVWLVLMAALAFMASDH